MRGLVLAVVVGMAFPAFAAQDAAPTMEAAKPDAVAPGPEPSTAEAAAPAAEPALAEAEPARPPVPADAVARATFATAIDQREPVDSITSLGNDRGRVFFFSEFVGIGGRELTHRWEYQGEVMAEVPIAIGGPRWRAYSSKQLAPGQTGEWTVSVVDESGNVVREESFVYEEPAPEVTENTTAPAVPEAAETPDEATEAAPASPAPTQP